MPILKVIPEPRFVREGRTKVFEADSLAHLANEQYTADLVKRHIERKQEKQDILSFVVNAKDPITGTIFDFEELQLNAQTLLFLRPFDRLIQCRFHRYHGNGFSLRELFPLKVSAYMEIAVRRSPGRISKC